jgi:beta-lactamase class D
MLDIEKRMFYLMLSATEGQKFASSMGFAPPSEDVQELEIMDVLSRWLMVSKSGIFDEMTEAAHWFVEFLEKTEKINSPPEDFVNALTVFAIALINKMLENGFIGLIVSDETLEELEGIEEYE